jgi:hypothetical protein
LLRDLDRRGYRETVTAVAEAAAAEGYTGPLSVDSMTTRQGELVPVLEVNARLSPGFIAQRLTARRPGVLLRLAFVRIGAEDAYERLVHALSDAGLLAAGGRGGVLPLAAGTLAPPRGWLFYAVVGDDGAAAGAEPELGGILEQLA